MATLQVEVREKASSAAVQRLRNEGIMPIALLTKTEGTKLIQAPRVKIREIVDSISGLTIFDVDGHGDKIQVILKEVQRDPATRQVIHVTLQEILDTDVIKANIPVKIEGTPEAVAKRQATLMIPMTQLAVKGKVSDLPDEVLVDVSEMEQNDRIIVSSLSGYDAIEFLTSPETVLATTKQLRGQAETTETEGEEGEEGEESEGGESTEASSD